MNISAVNVLFLSIHCYFFFTLSFIDMKTSPTLMVIILVILGYSAANAQVQVKERIRFKDTVIVQKYAPEENEFSLMHLKMAPGDFRIQNVKELSILRGKAITGVDLVYSDYPEGEDFTELNRKRVLELHIHVPEAFNTSVIKWQIVKQTGVAQTGGIQNYFHGFVIYYRPMPTFQEENKAISDVVEGIKPPSDSTLLKVFDRQKSWRNMLVVTDVTGSMSPYTAQLLLWIKSNQAIKTFKQIVFFNDDEEESNTQSGRLDTSGIWSIESGNSKKVIDKAFEAMQKGSHYENNLEAVCYAIKKYPENKQNVIMIADNWENPCDMYLVEFLKKEKVPLRIIVCGVNDRMNPIYLDLAFATGGSVHTMEDDLMDVAKIGEGKTVKFGKQKFKMTGGKFIQI